MLRHGFRRGWLLAIPGLVVLLTIAVRADEASSGKAPALLVAPFDSSRAHEAQDAWARQLNGKVEVTNSIGMKLRLVPPGEFSMGTAAGAPYEKPLHNVRITKPFYLGVCEVTQQEYERVTGRNSSFFCQTGFAGVMVRGLETSRFPVENVTWYDAVEFCNALSEKERLSACYRLSKVEREKDGAIRSAAVQIEGGKGYRLPTEAEWEYACRAGTQTAYSFGEKSNGHEANLKGTEPLGTQEKGPYLQRTSPVASYTANAFGLFDMHGNVWEWCQDWRGDDYYQHSPPADPQGPESGLVRIDRGGGWLNTCWDGQSGIRGGREPSYRNGHVGFRVTRSP